MNLATGAGGQDRADAISTPGWIRPIRNRRAFEEIIDQLEGALLSRQLVPGARLPPERDLAAALGVSRPSVREALRVLESLGLVDVQRGPAGVTLRREPGDAFANILRLHLALGHYAPSSIIELRCVLESWAFSETARRADEKTLQRLEALLGEMARPGLEPPAFNEIDVAFHSAVIEACRNELAALVLRGLRTVVRQEMLDGLASGSWPETAQSLVDEHARLYELIRCHDSDGAGQFIREHIQKWATRSLELGTLPGDESLRHETSTRKSPPDV